MSARDVSRDFFRSCWASPLGYLVDLVLILGRPFYTYTAQLGLKVRKTDIGTQKIDGSLLVTYSMVIAAFQVFDTLSRSWFF